MPDCIIPFSELFNSQRNAYDSRYKFTANKSCHTKDLHKLQACGSGGVRNSNVIYNNQ
jgi:hypothetical protein